MPFLARRSADEFIWSGDGPCGPLDQIPSRVMNRAEAAEYLRGHGETEGRITELLNGTVKNKEYGHANK